MAKILLVDDEAETRANLRAMLELMGHEVLDAAGGRDGCLLAESQLFDCAVVDIFMPGMDGLETIQILKSLHPEMPVVVLAGEGRISPDLACRLALALGADHALRKPVDSAALSAVFDNAAWSPPTRSARPNAPSPAP
jgi:two-component system, NtrC family, nitrogen regulation response regulator NtrX